MYRFKVKTKILICVLNIVSAIIMILTLVTYHLERKQTEKQIGEVAVSIAKSVATLPEIKHAFKQPDPALTIDPIVESIREEVGAEFIVVGNKNNIRYSHIDPNMIGKLMQGGDNDLALIHGKSYVSKAEGTLGPSLRGKAPIFDENGEIIGIVSVGYMTEQVEQLFRQDFKLYALWSFVVLIFGSLASLFLANSIKRDTLGLEPIQIANLYVQRSAILESVSEGIIAIDRDYNIILINKAAKERLKLDDRSIGTSIEGLLPLRTIKKVMETQEMAYNHEVLLKDRSVIIHYTVIQNRGETVGLVASFRDRSQVQDLINTLSEVHQYSQDLRAQAHEYTNRMYTISGLLQTGQTQSAIEFIHKETNSHKLQTKILYEQCKDLGIQAIVLGKINRASEKKITFTLNPESHIEHFFPEKHLTYLITILGNIIDNAFDAVRSACEKEVELFFTDVGKDVVFEISDSGEGLPAVPNETLFQRGYTTKNGLNRGIGLALVADSLKEIGGSIECHARKKGGTVFTVFIPKEGESHENTDC
ncbi:sensor histidine kinase [Alkalihalobacillus sp. FSL R5-0424]